MSRGEIIEHIGEGKYKVRQKFAQESVANEIGRLSTRIADLAVALPTAKLELLQAEGLVSDKAREIDLLVPDFQAGVDGSREAITQAQSELVALQAAAGKLRIKTDELIAENLAALKRRNQLQSAPESKDIEAWCADYTLDLAGEVGIADINDEGGQGVVIQPGYNGAAAYEAARDGELYHNIAQSSAQVYFNAAIMPGVQKWLPRYRVGEITTITNDICTVALDSAESSAQGLPINETESLTDIPIVYMDCNGSAFSEGDRVIVRFTKSGPLVVGFESNPESCSLFGFVFEPANLAGVIPPTYKARKNTYGKPFKIEEMEINPPLGTPGGDRVAWTALPKDGILEIDQGNTRHYGNKNWFNSDKVVLSWAGPPGRAHRLDQIKYTFTQFLEPWETKPYVYHDLRIILDLSEHPEASSFQHVYGAAIRNGEGEGERQLVVIASNYDHEVGQRFQAFSVGIDESYQLLGPLTSMGSIKIDDDMMPQSHFYFSEDGSKAVCTIIGDVESIDEIRIELVRFNMGGFSTEEIWNQSNPVGTRSVTYNEDFPPSDEDGNIYHFMRSDGTTQVGQHQVPIYCDYIGNKEVTTFEVRPGSYRSYKYRWKYTSGWPAGPQTEHSTTDNRGETDEFRIETSEGDVLFKMSTKTYTRYRDMVSSGAPGWGDYFSGSRSDESRYGGIGYRDNILAIDARFKFCAANYGGYEYTKSESASGPGDEVFYPGVGSVTGGIPIEMVEVWIDGVLVEEFLAKEDEQRVSLGGFTHSSSVDIEHSYSHTVPIKPDRPLKIGSKMLLTAAAYRTGSHEIASFAMNYQLTPTQYKPLIFNRLSGYSDPVSQVLQRSESAGYMLCSVGLV